MYEVPQNLLSNDFFLIMNFLSIQDLINHNACMGCGSCAFLSNGRISMEFNEYGNYQPVGDGNDLLSSGKQQKYLDICPSSSSIDEDALSKDLFESFNNYHAGVGYYLQTFIGYSSEFRSTSSS